LVEGGNPVDRLFQIIAANPAQFLAIGFLIVVVVLGWAVESSAWRGRHR
jgi:hypothetical protein